MRRRKSSAAVATFSWGSGKPVKWMRSGGTPYCIRRWRVSGVGAR